MGACLRSSRNKVQLIDNVPVLNFPKSLSSERTYSHTMEKPAINHSRKSKNWDSQWAYKSCITSSDPSSANRLCMSMSPSDESNTVLRVPLTKITSKLFIGSLQDAMCEEELRNNGITHIISVIGSKHLVQGIQHEQIPMNDGGNTNLKLVMKKLSPFIKDSQQHGKVLFIHCMSGQNRSATVMLAILMLNKGKKLSEAWKILKNKRPLVQINARYAKQLLQMEKEKFGTNSLPSNWMEISRYNIKSGSVSIIGDSVSTLTSKQSAKLSNDSIVLPSQI